ncbi:anthranilate phosphoribosyltransferase [Coraliomargarita sp. SDUM461004]|uniref:Anthranilate phosphoribosyltransferase n=1 Tax=Thalassobacterium sedimentorum TaxID=3041258 RepID=A0ABU1AEB5_9BACT|nr:anthranilate phosphoribosyltransferase [Coraliomargarita sp. SDUM461004]MDQ8193050.1 anthranilate phosphoribosyltransferase [Coraliomargarita sp. SDUM461004]
MLEIEELTSILVAGQDLTSEEAQESASLLALPEVELEMKQNFLIALAEKGETAVEVAAFAATFRSLALDPQVEGWAEQAIDVCGTGGDGSSTFNISTAVSFIVAAAGVPVFKHGNRSITSKCGSADLIEALGIRLEAPHELLRASLDALNFCFFFAPAFHPAFKEIMPVRKALAEGGRRSVFNLLGPLINPGRPAYQLMGVYSERWVVPIADALDVMGLSAGLVAHCTPAPGMALDELSCAGMNRVAGFGRFKQLRGELPAQQAGLEACDLDSLSGGDVQANVKTLLALFNGSSDAIPQGLLNSLLLNAGVALWVAGKSVDLESGVALAREIVESGQAGQWLRRAQSFYSKQA